MPVYDFNKPEDMAAYLESVPQKEQARFWCKRFARQKSDDFMQKVYQIVRVLLRNKRQKVYHIMRTLQKNKSTL